MPKVYFNDPTIAVETDPHLSILETALSREVPIYNTCGGNASCSTCRVKILEGGENLSPMEEVEAQVLEAFDLESPFRLACQTYILKGSTRLEIPEREKPCRPNKTPALPNVKG